MVKHCQKKYCECYNVGKPCGNKCKCCECKNIEQNDSIYKISNKLNEKNYTNHKRQRNGKFFSNNSLALGNTEWERSVCK